MKFGINLFTVRNLIQTEEDLIKTAYILKEQGYSYLQYSGAPIECKRLKRLVKETELPVVLTHAPFERIVGDTQALMDEHAEFGCKRIGLGMMPPPVLADEGRMREAVSALEEAALRMAKRGFSLFYHHHHFEFYRHGETTVLAYMLKNAPRLHFTVDTYWLQYGGAPVPDILDRFAGRMECVHLKDYKIKLEQGEEVRFLPEFAPIGEGNMDFIAIVRRMSALGTKYFLVEQDNAADLPDPLSETARSASYLKQIPGGTL